MDKLAKKLKSIIKEGALEKYLLARGINPNFISKDQKIAHAKSGAFLKWKNDHMFESADKKDTVVLDIPLLIRVLELAREDIKTDMDLHRVVEKLISIRNKGVLTMADYDTIAKINEEMVSELSNELLQRYKDKAKKSAEDLASKGQYKKSNDRYLSHMKATGKQIERTTSSIRKSLRGEEVVAEMDKSQKGPPGWNISDDDEQSPPRPKVSKKDIKAIKKDPAKHLSDLFSREYAKKKVKEEVEEVDEGLKQKLAGLAVAGAMAASAAGHAHAQDSRRITPNEPDTRWSHVQQTPAPEKKPEAKPEAKKDGPGFSKEYLQQVKDGSHPRPMVSKEKAEELLKKHYNEEVEQIDEISKKTARQYTDKVVDPVYGMPRSSEKLKQRMKGLEAAHKRLTGKVKTSESADCGCMDNVDAADKNKKLIQMSKSARIIKSLYKRKGMREDTYGKKPSMKTIKNNMEDKIQASAVLTGGRTLTGQTRDTLEIDPMMRKAGPIDQNKKFDNT